MREQQKVVGEASLSLVKFDDQFDVVYEDKDLNSADGLTESTVQPGGSTVVFDAVGCTICAVGRRFAATAQGERPDSCA